jgi:HK97 family phage portal protein
MEIQMFERIKSYFSQPSLQQFQPDAAGGFIPARVLDVLTWQNPSMMRRLAAPVATAHACVLKYVDAVSALPMRHYRDTESDGPIEIRDSRILRFLRRPNDLQTRSQFLTEGVMKLFTEGNAVALIERNGSTTTARWATSFQIRLDPESGAAFYDLTMPRTGQRKDLELRGIGTHSILHLRINPDPDEPMQGRSPTNFCSSSLAVNAILSAFLQSFLGNRASPSYALSTDTTLTSLQMKQLREAFAEQSTDLKAGGTPILGSGLKPVALGAVPPDAMTKEVFDLSSVDICRAFGVPAGLINASNDTAGNTAALNRAWLSSGLGSLLEQIEQVLEQQFLSPAERIEFDTAGMLRTSPLEEAQRVQALMLAGVLAPDEAREMLDLPRVHSGFGKTPMVQQQMLPLDLAAALHAANIARANADPANPPPPPSSKFVQDLMHDLVTQREATNVLRNQLKAAK